MMFRNLMHRVLASNNPLLLSAGVIWGANALGFTITALTHTHKITDLTGTGAFVLSVWSTYGLLRYQNGLVSPHKPLPSRPLLLTLAVSVWGARLGGFLFNRILQSPEDSRLSEFFPKVPGQVPIKLAFFWHLQACWAFFSLLPVTMAHRLPVGRAASGWSGRAGYVGWVLFAVGLLCETIADHQKSVFKSRPGNSGAFCDEGLWAHSRHPNYFGELTLWWGLWLVAAAHVPKWCVVSPLWVTSLLVGISGVPIMEKKYDEKFSGRHPLRDAYARYKKETSILVPLPRFP